MRSGKHTGHGPTAAGRLVSGLLAAVAALAVGPAASASATPAAVPFTVAPPEAVPSTVGGTSASLMTTVSVSVGRLILEPTERGYGGTLPIDITYDGPTLTEIRMVLTEPILGSYQQPTIPIDCYSLTLVEEPKRRQVECPVPGGEFRPGERRVVQLPFAVLTPVRSYPMLADEGRVDLAIGGKIISSVGYRTVFRSSTGSLDAFELYVPDEQPDAAVTADDATLRRQPNGGYAGRVRVTVRYDSDAPHYGLILDVRVPAGVEFIGIDSQEACAHFCVPGGPFLTGEQRTITLLLTAPVGTRPGELGEGSVQVAAEMPVSGADDSDMSDNTASFRIEAAG